MVEKLEWRLEAGEGRTKISLTAGMMGKGLVVLALLSGLSRLGFSNKNS